MLSTDQVRCVGGRRKVVKASVFERGEERLADAGCDGARGKFLAALHARRAEGVAESGHVRPMLPVLPGAAKEGGSVVA